MKRVSKLMLTLSLMGLFLFSIFYVEKLSAESVVIYEYKKVFLRSDCKAKVNHVCIIRDWPKHITIRF